MGTKAHTIEIVITPEGKVKGEVKGVTGQECGPLSKWLDEIGQVEVDKHSADFYKQPDQNLTNRR